VNIFDGQFSDKDVLVTGGLGFIGARLAARLIELGARVTLIDSLNPEYGGNWANIAAIRDRVTVNICDVRDPYAMSYLIQGKEFLFNLAAQTGHVASMQDPLTDLAINAEAQLSLMEACRNHNPGIKVVFTSTRQLYGKPEYLPVDERHPVRPVDVNGVNKLAGEGYHLLYNNVYGIRTCVLRLTNTYGPGIRVKDARQTFLGIWVRRLLEGKPIQIFGDGLQLRDFNYVDDCVDALLLCAASDVANGQVFNLGSGEVINLRDLAALITNVGWAGEYEMVPFPAERKAIDIGDYYGDFTLIRDTLGWTPKTSLEQGLRLTLEYYAAQRDYYWQAEQA